MKRIALLTSSRADYSIYYPLISKFKSSKEFELDIIAFGNHNSLLYGNSAKRIEEDGFEINIETDDIVDFSSFKKGIEILEKYKIVI